MEIAMIGLGKMGSNMVRRLLGGGHRVVAFDLDAGAVARVARDGAVAAESLGDLARKLDTPRAVWVMVPAGVATERTVEALLDALAPGDLIVDGGNSNYRDTQALASRVADAGLHFVDVGTSGGIWGLEGGYSMMVGGEAEAVERLRGALETLAPAPDRGWGHVGPSGAGHFTKMVHNGIEYGMMQAYAEGFDLLRAKEELHLDLHQVAEIWRTGSVVRSWLLDLIAGALEEDPALDGFTTRVEDSGEGRWTVAESIDLRCAIPVITAALQARFRSRDEEQFSGRLVSALRHQFGGHAAHDD
ncbi:MAG: decarboxylating 6-phosphogluconate dehydrogenase [Holophagales bacterium]|nr:decarboxylating 6-phosphogluconate dehydrogenase [Holophagales bacterium]